MPRKSLLVASVSTVLLVAPGQAAASHRSLPFDATATISACRGESLTIAAKIEPAADATRRARRVIRRASLRLRFEAAPLYGKTHKSREFDLGRTSEVRRSVRFADLPAQGYSGIVRYRWKRGKRTVLSGLFRTRKARVAGKKGKAFCSLRVGRRPVDTTAPFIAPIPSDSAWYRGPLTVRFFVFDDLSGVALVVSRIDGGPFVRGRSNTVEGEGAHKVEYVARDAAGNQTPIKATMFRVDEHPPTRPVVTAPTSPTTDTTPEITWNASTDSASGVAGYVIVVRNSGGAIVFSRGVPATALRSVTVSDPLPVGSYTAEVVAVDATVDQPFTATGSRAFSVVAPPPNQTPPDTDGDKVADNVDNCPNDPNPNQENVDGDEAGDYCDDSDGDGLTDHQEIVSSPHTEWDDPDTDHDDDGTREFWDGSDECPTQPRGLADTDRNGCPGLT